MLTEKDKATIANKLKSKLASSDRVMIKDASPAIVGVLHSLQNDIDASFAFVKNSHDVPNAAALRNSGKKTVFVFYDVFQPDSYFTGTSSEIRLSKALQSRALQAA